MEGPKQILDLQVRQHFTDELGLRCNSAHTVARRVHLLCAYGFQTVVGSEGGVLRKNQEARKGRFCLASAVLTKEDV